MRTWVEIDTQAILHNCAQIKEHLPGETKLMAVVKADAYGHGAVRVAELLADSVDCFGVASVYEAVELRKNGIERDLLILGGTSPEQYGVLMEYGVMPTLYDEQSVAAFLSAAEGKKVACFVAVDTGMSRIGFPDNEAGLCAIEALSKNENVSIRGLFSHFARADEADKSSAKEQYRRFCTFTEALTARGVSYGVRSISNSAGIMELDTSLDMVRAGIILYGVYPSDEVNRSLLALKPALSLRTRVELVKTVPAGIGISYGHRYVTDRETRVATLCCGYADGVPRLLSDTGSVLLHGKRASILGRVCMDQMMVDVTDIPEVKIGDVATVIGRDGEATISVDEVASLADTIPYEILCSLSRPRLPRVYE